MRSKYERRSVTMDAEGRTRPIAGASAFKPVRRRPPAGFTIFEILLATVILAICIIGGAAFFSANRKSLAYASTKDLATWSAVSRMEELKSAAYASLTSGTTTQTITISGRSVQRRTTIQAGVSLSTVTVEMDWGAGTFPVSMTTYISIK